MEHGDLTLKQDIDSPLSNQSPAPHNKGNSILSINQKSN